jgi:TPR repeat protein
VCYREGEGVVRSSSEAVRYYAMARAHGNVHATFNLALCMEDGMIIPDLPDKQALYHEAAENGHVRSQIKLARQYM